MVGVAGSGRDLARVMVAQVVAAGSLWGSGLPRVWGFGRNALVAGWATGRLTGWRLGGIVAEWGSGGPSRCLNYLCPRRLQCWREILPGARESN
jgi:hypothetical protein